MLVVWMFCVAPELLHQNVYKEEEPKAPHIKEEQDKVCSSQLGLKQENQGLILTSAYEENDQCQFYS